MSNKAKCAACGGTIEQINIVFWLDYPVELCASCMTLGSPDVHDMTDGEIQNLVHTRANPRAPIGGAEGRVRAWIKERYGEDPGAVGDINPDPAGSTHEEREG